jgi:DNA invertase Pin-like site-specific DNA recombinase
MRGQTADRSKSAATQSCPEGAEMQKQTTILYCRLSRDDGDSDRKSNSISNQKRILSEYAEKNCFVPYEPLCDDGYSGTNFQRPGWTELIARIDSGEVGAIIVKSLDRIGRNYLQTGLYREMFKERGVRLIAVSDNIDTFSREEDDFVPFREIMAEWYARDCSRKVKSVLTAKGRDCKPLSPVVQKQKVRLQRRIGVGCFRERTSRNRAAGDVGLSAETPRNNAPDRHDGRSKPADGTALLLRLQIAYV